MPIASFNLLQALPDAHREEVFETLASGSNTRIERIVSQGQCSPQGFWYDQAQHEWVLVLQGRARLEFLDEARSLDIQRGDSVYLPAHCRHRVAWTDPDQATVWLAVFYDP